MGAGNRHWFKRIADQPGGSNAIVALCDPDRRNLENSLAEHSGAKRYADYRKMLETEKGLDAVMVSTPDHHHYPASMMAIKLGIAVNTETPLTHSVWEARQLALAARKYKVATQMDNEAHASEGLHRCGSGGEREDFGGIPCDGYQASLRSARLFRSYRFINTSTPSKWARSSAWDSMRLGHQQIARSMMRGATMRARLSVRAGSNESRHGR